MEISTYQPIICSANDYIFVQVEMKIVKQASDNMQIQHFLIPTQLY